MSNEQTTKTSMCEKTALKTSQKVRFIIGIVISVLTLLAFIFSMIFGISAFDIQMSGMENWEGLGFVILFLFLIFSSAACLVCAVIGAVLNITTLKTDVKKVNKTSIVLLIVNCTAALLNTILFILICVLY